MESADAVAVLAALGQITRLEVFKLLVREEPNGVASSDIAAKLDVPRNTMSSHLRILESAGLVRSERSSRQIFYRAELPQLAQLTSFLLEGCCGNRPELCGPVLGNILAQISSCT